MWRVTAKSMADLVECSNERQWKVQCVISPLTYWRLRQIQQSILDCHNLIFFNMELIFHVGCSTILENLWAVDYFPSDLLFKASNCVTLLLTTTQNSMTSITKGLCSKGPQYFLGGAARILSTVCTAWVTLSGTTEFYSLLISNFRVILQTAFTLTASWAVHA